MKEKETNLGLKIEDDTEGVNFIIHGRGELHLSVLIENMRREGYEMQISKPQVVYKTIDGAVCEPYEEVTIDVPQDYMGFVSEELGKRKGQMINMTTDHNNNTRLIYKISSQNLLGIRNTLMTRTRGTAIMSSYLLGYEPKGTKMESLRNGALVATQSGVALSYGIANAQDRGKLFISPQTEVYQGMIVGQAAKEQDVEVNVCKGKQLTNNRSSGEGVNIHVEPASPMTLEQSLDFLNDDELLEVTPINLRLRKMYLTEAERRIHNRKGK